MWAYVSAAAILFVQKSIMIHGRLSQWIAAAMSKIVFLPFFMAFFISFRRASWCFCICSMRSGRFLKFFSWPGRISSTGRFFTLFRLLM